MGKNECSLSRLPRGVGDTSHHFFFLRPQASTDLLLKYGTAVHTYVNVDSGAIFFTPQWL